MKTSEISVVCPLLLLTQLEVIFLMMQQYENLQPDKDNKNHHKTHLIKRLCPDKNKDMLIKCLE